MMIRHKISFVCATALMVVFARGVSGETLTAGWTIYNGSTDAGLFTLISNDPNASQFVQVTSGTIASFCIDTREFIYPGAGANFYNVVALTDAPNYAGGTSADHFSVTQAKEIAQLWRYYINPNIDDYVDDSVSNSDLNTAFQEAVWKIEYGPSYVFGSPSASALSKVTDMFTWLANNPNAPTAKLMALSAPSGPATGSFQDQIVEVRPAPEPATVVSLATILTAVCLSSARKLKNWR
jgi:hypothetical protein